ncbi:MAG: ABC transporter permease [Lewinellaceae bacterium]|nr:ABC transporter permease [Lewinellaceae bacterium]
MKKLLLALFLTALLLPFAYLLLLSVAGQWRYPDVLPPVLSTANWRLALSAAGGIGGNLCLSVLLSAGVAAIVTVGGFVLGKIIAGHPGRARFQAIAYLPFAFSPVIYAYCLQFFFLKADLSGSIAGVLLAQVLLLLPFGILFFSTHWDERLRAMEQLTLTLGGTPRDAWRRVLIPVSRPALLTAFFQAFLLSWFDYGLTSVIGLGQVPTLSVMVWQFIGEANPYFAAIGSCLLVFPPAILLFINKKIVFRG